MPTLNWLLGRTWDSSPSSKFNSASLGVLSPPWVVLFERSTVGTVPPVHFRADALVRGIMNISVRWRFWQRRGEKIHRHPASLGVVNLWTCGCLLHHDLMGVFTGAPCDTYNRHALSLRLDLISNDFIVIQICVSNLTSPAHSVACLGDAKLVVSFSYVLAVFYTILHGPDFPLSSSLWMSELKLRRDSNHQHVQIWLHCRIWSSAIIRSPRFG